MNVLLVNGSDRGGGAEKIATDLLRSYERNGHRAWLAVALKQTENDRVVVIEQDRHRNAWARFCLRCVRPLERPSGMFPPRSIRRGVRLLRETVSEPGRVVDRFLGHEDFHSPGTQHLTELVPGPVDLLHLHNLHGRYFDLQCLPELSRHRPVVLTLHDAWLLAGHCSHSFDCERWQTGCGHCPDLTIYPPLLRDGTAFNWQRKKSIYAASRLYVATPSRWLMSKVEQSMMAAGIREARVIPNGVNLEVFRPRPQEEVRIELGLPVEAKIVLFVANKIRHNPFKDFLTMRAALEKAGTTLHSEKICFLAVGEGGKSVPIPGADSRLVPFQSDEGQMAKYYQAADVYMHGARADTFPSTILEASACGIPVVASKVGGIPEQVEEEKTGFLVPVGDADCMAYRVTQLLRDPARCATMGRLGAERVQQRFGVEGMVSAYLDWFQEILRSWQKA